MPTHIAAIATASDVVSGDVCDLSIMVAEPYETFDQHGNETTEYVASDAVVFTTDLTVLIADDDKLAKAEAEADEVLYRNGWIRTAEWTIADNAMYADLVEDPAA